MVMLLQTPPAVNNEGWLPPALMITLVDEVGTPPHQFDGSFQSVLVVPSHVPGVHELVLTFIIPEEVVPK